METQNVLLEVRNNIAYLIINREDKLNALNQPTIAELEEALISIKDNKDVKVVILTGAGKKAFVAGADISQFTQLDEAGGLAFALNGQKVLALIENCRKPVIAAVNGFALGGGLEIAMSCHIRVASDNAKVGLPEVSLGVIPGYGGTQRLAQLVGKGKAFEMIATAQMITAEEALRWGLVNHVTSQEELMPKCEEIASRIMKNSPVAIAHAFRSVNACFEDGVDGYNVEAEKFGKCFTSEDVKEGVGAFLEKRKPAFTGR